MIKRLWYSLLSNDKPQDKNVIWIDTSNSESFTLKLYRNGGWKPLQVVGTSRDMIERELTGYVTSHYHSYDRIINKPTTLEGYGITDCFNKSEIERLLDDKVTKVDGMSLTSNNFSDKYKKMLDNLSTSYYNKKNVDNLLNEKQDVISDLESIREGAKKGSTALQSFIETDPIYLKDKPFIALKSDLLNDNNLVHKEGNEDIKGTKWFEHIRTNNFGIYQENNNNHSVYIDYYYNEDNYLPILHFGSEEDWLTILDNIADPVDDFHAANKNYVDSKISSTEGNLVHKDGYERITAIKQFQKGIGVGLFNALVANEDGVQSGAWLDQNEDPAPFIVADPSADDHAATKYYVDEGLATKQPTLTDTDGSYGQRVANLEKTKQDTLTAGNGISIEGGVISSTVDSLITPITYAELVALRGSSSLVAGMQYRITDYACTTTQASTQSAGHPFDIIVTADSENTLNEEARAIQHEGDTYFADCDLNAWKIWYCLDNNTTRFAWADSVNGKGVIYRMIDEWNNDVPYDFKNIQFARDWSVIAPDSGLAGTIYCYTFSVFLDGFSEDATANDESIKAKECIKSDGDGIFGNNVIRTYQDSLDNYTLNSIIFVTDWSSFSVRHYSNTFGYDCYNNTFGNNCNDNTFGNNCNHNIFGNYCSCIYFGNYCQHIKFASSSSATTKYNYYQQNHFGDGCQYILFKGAETASYSAQVQNYNFAQGLQGTSSAYIEIDGVRSRAYETKVAKNSSGELKIYCEADLIA